MLGLESDNGSEFITQGLWGYCQREGIPFTRSRPYKKNDSAHVEQKNGAIIRALIGYDRYTSKAAYAQLTRVYRLVRLHVNVFQPVQQLVSKTRDGARVRRLYDRARTPSQRLCATDALTPATRQELEPLSQSLNPLQLRRQIEAELERLWALAAPDPHRRQGLELDDAACRACEVACSFHLTGTFDRAQLAIRINVNVRTGALLVDTRAACDMCRDEPVGPRCTAICPSDAIRAL